MKITTAEVYHFITFVTDHKTIAPQLLLRVMDLVLMSAMDINIRDIPGELEEITLKYKS